MGIHDLNPFVKAHAPRTFRRVNTRLFRNKRVAVDTPLWAFASYSTVFGNYASREMPVERLISSAPLPEEVIAHIRSQIFDKARMFMNDLESRGITPIFVFDGTSVPEKTSGARARRAAARDSKAARIASLRAQLNDVDPLFRGKDDVETLRKLVKNSPPINPREDIAAIRSYIENSGAAVVSAPDEAEKYCAFLARKGVVAAVWTTDTDSYAFGAPLFITGYSDHVDAPAEDENATTTIEAPVWYGANVPRWSVKPTHFNVTAPPIAFKSLGLTRFQFTDLCILLECDFNTRMPGVGPVKAWALISSAREKSPSAQRLIEIAAADNPHLPWELLNAERCRSIFLNDEACEEHFKQNRHIYASLPGENVEIIDEE